MLPELITRGSGMCALILNDIAHLCRMNARARVWTRSYFNIAPEKLF